MAKKWGRKGEPVTVRLPSSWLRTMDRLVQARTFESRTHAIEHAVEQLLRLSIWSSNRWSWIQSLTQTGRNGDVNDAVISVRLPSHYLKYIDELVGARMFRHRSEVIKTALLHFLPEPEPEESPSLPSKVAFNSMRRILHSCALIISRAFSTLLTSPELKYCA
ncbi:MAG: ribbon-helix-helix domain-containing protein [Acidilobaceae archaeon]|nr:ribbon-helix-helix domain-containing protein [Acidilobaceae archaeon]